MMDFTGQVAVVTGAGRGLGRAHALLLASRGAAVVVNDLGGALDGTGASAEPAEAVVAEIRAAGGTAVADTHSVATSAGASAIIDRAVTEFGRLDVLVNNAGTTGGHPVFGSISDDDLMSVLGVHLLGAFHMTQAAWAPMTAQGYGRVVNTTSGVGFFGLPRATTYAAAKLGIVGLTRSVCLEGEPLGIKVNAVAPVARTRMADGVFGELDQHLDPAKVSPVVAYLAHRDCALNGAVLSAGAGRVAELFLGATRGHFDADLIPEDVRDHLATATDRAGYEVPANAMAEVEITAEFTSF